MPLSTIKIKVDLITAELLDEALTDAMLTKQKEREVKTAVDYMLMRNEIRSQVQSQRNEPKQ